MGYNPFQAILQIDKHELQSLGPFGIRGPGKPYAHAPDLVCIDCVDELEGLWPASSAIAQRRKVCKLLCMLQRSCSAAWCMTSSYQT